MEMFLKKLLQYKSKGVFKNVEIKVQNEECSTAASNNGSG